MMESYASVRRKKVVLKNYMGKNMNEQNDCDYDVKEIAVECPLDGILGVAYVKRHEGWKKCWTSMFILGVDCC